MKFMDLLNSNWSRKVIGVTMGIAGVVFIAQLDSADPAVAVVAMYLVSGLGALQCLVQGIIDFCRQGKAGRRGGVAPPMPPVKEPRGSDQERS